MKAVVHVTLRNGVLDPQGDAVRRSLGSLGFAEVENVRVGKMIELDLTGEDRAGAEVRVAQMCEKLLANTVIEKYTVEII